MDIFYIRISYPQLGICYNHKYYSWPIYPCIIDLYEKMQWIEKGSVTKVPIKLEDLLNHYSRLPMNY
jgi:hypothetical protein